MKKLLFATDFSDDSKKAFEYTLQLASQLKAEVVVVHTYLPPYVDPSTPVELISTMQNEIVDSLTERLAFFVQEQNTAVPIDAKLVYSDVTNGINQTAAEENCDLIVIGKTGQTGFLQKLIGSNAASLVNNSRTPLLMIPADVPAALPTHFLYGTQLEHNEKAQFKKALDFATALNAHITLINVSAPFEPNIRPDGPYLEDFRNEFGKEVELIQAERISDGLLAAAHERGANVLVVSAHHRNFLSQLVNPSKSQRVINKADMPVLVLHFD